MSSLQQALQSIREQASNDVERGTAFEKLVRIFLENDATQQQQYSQVWHYVDWARGRPRYPTQDAGIDLVAQLRDEDDFCAIQCKFYQPDHAISKADLDSFISASSTSDFTRLVLIDTSTQPISKNAETVFANLTQDYIRIQLTELEESRIDWTAYIQNNEVRLHPKKTLRDDQQDVLKEVKAGLADSDRGNIVMACGTGKTFTSLRIAEEIAGAGKHVLYMVPSLELMSQTIREWKNDASEDFTAFSACSDDKVGKRKSSDDPINVSLNDLAFPATTDARKLSEKIEKIAQSKKSAMTVVFSTYHSIDVIAQSQHDYGLGEFDLIICDEAHRTTGANFTGDDESHFTKIHNNDHVRGKKRLYMTATPRIYGEPAKRKEKEGSVNLASMDDKAIFGETLIHRSFAWAVENNLLTDYKVVILVMDEQVVSDRVQKALSDGPELKLNDATKMVGCYKALAKVGISNRLDDDNPDNRPMKRALAFCQNIALSKMFCEQFSAVVDEYNKKFVDEYNEEMSEPHKTDLEVQLHHVDGTFNAEKRSEKLRWLKKDNTESNICRVLTNVRCLSEGVDVPALDAIMFLHPRKSQIDVIQSVGRVMRKAEGKKLGYVILPIAVAPGISPERALDDNERYRVVWQILNALRAHDERLDRTINRISLGEDVSDRIEIVIPTTAVVDDVKKPSQPKEKDEGTNIGGEQTTPANETAPEQLSFTLTTDLSQAIKARIVEKCGTRDYWEKWAADIATIAQQHIARINSIVLNSNAPERKAFMQFVKEIQDDLNPEITEKDAVEMLAQHIITRPVFDTLFQNSLFTSDNAVSKAMETVLSQIYAHNIEAESDKLKPFYKSVKGRAEDISTSKGRQALILDLYSRFFSQAFKSTTEKLGIVYTPVEVVDFIIHSVEDVMKEEFGSSLGHDSVHILDPFAGAGTFISRLLQSGIMSKEQIQRKFNSEIHANEIVLLAYYIACINIEAVYKDAVEQPQVEQPQVEEPQVEEPQVEQPPVEELHYQPFEGMVLTDTFQLYEQDKDMVHNLLPDNSERRTKQKARDITVVIGNPPYSAGQRSANDNAANAEYPNLNKRIKSTYAARSSARNKNSLYNNYIRAFRWASDRIGEDGIIGFVTGAGWVDRTFADGMRATLGEEFQTIYILHLRGDIRKDMLSHRRAGEGGNIFGQASMIGSAITILVKNKKSADHGKIFFHDIGDYLDREQKLARIAEFKSISGLAQSGKLETIIPNKSHDWIHQRNEKFDSFPPLGDKGNKNTPVFLKYTHGVKTNRDAWCINFSKTQLIANLEKMTSTYHAQFPLVSPDKIGETLKQDPRLDWDPRLDRDPKKISWSDDLYKHLARKTEIVIDKAHIRTCLYRPFQLTHLYFDNRLNERRYQTHKIFPKHDSHNWVICVTGPGSRSGFSCLMAKLTPILGLIEAGQCFPLFLFDHNTDSKTLLTREGEKHYAIHPSILKNINDVYNLDKQIQPQDTFFYIYGLFHSPDYKHHFANNLAKELPRMPLVKNLDDFRAFSRAGRLLSGLHADFQAVDPYPVTIKQGDLRLAQIKNPQSFYRVEKMKFEKGDQSTLIYNNNITLQNIPLEAYDYVVNGKPALKWVMEHQGVKTDKASGIIDDANVYANETMNNPAYPLELFQRVITVSLETMKIVKSLPKLDFD